MPKIEGILVSLRYLDLQDASTLLEWRNNSKINKYLSNSGEKITLEQQIKWQTNIRKRTDSHDFIIEFNTKPIGACAIYDINKNEAEFGRFIVTNPLGAIDAELCCLNYAFHSLNLNSIICKTVLNNTKVWQQHYSLGFEKVGEDYDARIDQKRILQVITKDKFINFDYSSIEKMLLKFKNR